MTRRFAGGCACGAVRYAIAAEPIFANDCQCRDCQRISGTGHGSYLTFPSRADVALTGNASEWSVAADSGSMKTRGFCPTCGAPVYLTFAAMPDLFTIHAASLDDPALYTPAVVTYTVRAQSWDHVDPTLPSFAAMPTP